MKTGVKPVDDREYDIDVGLRFDFHEDKYNAENVRRWVYAAVKDHTKRIEDKGPCVRVVYEAGYHLDLVSYAVWETDGTDQYRLAHKSRGWVSADPPKLLEHVDNARKPFKGTEDEVTKTDQFRRSVRYLRRWDDVAIPRESKSKPSGLAFVLLCRDRLQPSTRLDGTPDDAKALREVARYCGQLVGRVTANKPTPEYEEMFSALSESEMGSLKSRFTKLADALDAAATDPDPVKACETLRKEFGDDFPVPDPGESARKTSTPAVVTSSSSA